MHELKKKIGKVFTCKCVGTGPSSFEKGIYRAAVSQRLRNTAIRRFKFMLIVIDVIQLPQKRSLREKCYQAVRPSVRLSLCVYQRGSHWTDFREIWYWRLLGKHSERIEIFFKLCKNIRHIA
jgi:hypothetical protein